MVLVKKGKEYYVCRRKEDASGAESAHYALLKREKELRHTKTETTASKNPSYLIDFMPECFNDLSRFIREQDNTIHYTEEAFANSTHLFLQDIAFPNALSKEDLNGLGALPDPQEDQVNQVEYFNLTTEMENALKKHKGRKNITSDDYKLFSRTIEANHRISHPLELDIHHYPRKSPLNLIMMGISTCLSGTNFHWSSGQSYVKYLPQGSFMQTKKRLHISLSQDQNHTLDNCGALKTKLDKLRNALELTSFAPIGMSILVSFDEHGKFNNVTAIDPAHGFSDADRHRHNEQSHQISNLQRQYKQACIDAIDQMKNEISIIYPERLTPLVKLPPKKMRELPQNSKYPFPSYFTNNKVNQNTARCLQ